MPKPDEIATSAGKMVQQREAQFNGYKCEIDRRYAIYDVFHYVTEQTGFRIKLMVGSNQVLLYFNDKVIYDSDQEGELADAEKFKKWFAEQITTALRNMK